MLARLEAANLTPAPQADRRTLLRRLTFDLIGLPPTADEIDAFAADTAPDAVDRVVERLLASPHYGERWGRYWLDYARYSDTKGYTCWREDRKYPVAYSYRDWVIRALNDDLPYDQFLIHQVAADQLPDAGRSRQLAALGFLTIGRRFLNNHHDIIDDRLDVLCRTTMGLTVSLRPLPRPQIRSDLRERLLRPLRRLCQHSRAEGTGRPDVLGGSPNPHNARVLVRGNPGNQGEEAPRQFLPCLTGDRLPPFTQGSGRLELAQAIANRDNPLTAR